MVIDSQGLGLGVSWMAEHSLVAARLPQECLSVPAGIGNCPGNLPGVIDVQSHRAFDGPKILYPVLAIPQEGMFLSAVPPGHFSEKDLTTIVHGSGL
jgi:hypothetical protein